MSETYFEKLTKEHNPLVKCPYCGAEYDINLDFCPYCDSANEFGQENAYMDRLEDMEKNLGEMSDYASETYNREAKGTLKKILVPVLTILAIVVLIFSLLKFVNNYLTDSHVKETLDWQSENFPKLDEMYEAGDFEAMNDFIEDVLSSKDFHRTEIYNWSHYRFASAYGHYAFLKDIDEGEYDIGYINDMKDFIFNDALELAYGAWNTQLDERVITKRDYEYIQTYKEYVQDFMNRRFGITDLGEIARQCQLEPPAIGFELAKIRKVMDDYDWID